jgi:predicted AAA+ superfamily ATPase
MIERTITPLLRQLVSQYPVITLTGPRQSGKTTLAKSLFAGKPYVTLEDTGWAHRGATPAAVYVG